MTESEMQLGPSILSFFSFLPRRARKMRQILEQIARKSLEAIKLDPGNGAEKALSTGQSIGRHKRFSPTRELDDVGILS